MNKQELKILQVLDAIARQKSVSAIINSIVVRAERKLTRDFGALLTWEPVPLATYGGRLPNMIRSSWVFVVRAQVNTGAERHPNSCQRMMSYRGSGDLQIWAGGRWRSNLLVSDSGVKDRKKSFEDCIKKVKIDGLQLKLDEMRKQIKNSKQTAQVQTKLLEDYHCLKKEQRSYEKGKEKAKQESY